MKIDGYNIPEELYYNKEHEWVRIEKNGYIKIGITDYAQQTLKEITFVYFPKKGFTFNISETICTVESVKAISELYSPFTGEIIQVNDELTKKPNIINDDPFGKGWIITIRPLKFKEEVGKLIDSEQYAKYIQSLIKVDNNLLVYRWREKGT